MLRGETQENLHQKITLAQPSKILLKDYSQMLCRFFSFLCFASLILTPFSPIFRAFLSRSILFPAFPLAPIFDFDVTQILNFTCRNILHTRSNFIENEKLKKFQNELGRWKIKGKRTEFAALLNFVVLFNINLL